MHGQSRSEAWHKRKETGLQFQLRFLGVEWAAEMRKETPPRGSRGERRRLLGISPPLKPHLYAGKRETAGVPRIYPSNCLRVWPSVMGPLSTGVSSAERWPVCGEVTVSFFSPARCAKLFGPSGGVVM